jgi:phosphoribosylanthranilate isomerase
MSCIDSSLWVKICGLTQPEQAVAIARLGASAIGYIGVPSSPRYVTPLQMGAMGQALLDQNLTRVDRVGVFVNLALDEMGAAITTGQLTMVQLHGQESPETCAQVRATYPSIKLIKAFRIRSAADLTAVDPYCEVVDSLLLDAYHPQLMGGTGKTLDWAALQQFRPGTPWILAGGLNSDNIGHALSLLSPYGIDLSSSVESSPGIKSLDKVEQLFANLKQIRPS